MRFHEGLLFRSLSVTDKGICSYVVYDINYFCCSVLLKICIMITILLTLIKRKMKRPKRKQTDQVSTHFH